MAINRLSPNMPTQGYRKKQAFQVFAFSNLALFLILSFFGIRAESQDFPPLFLPVDGFSTDFDGATQYVRLNPAALLSHQGEKFKLVRPDGQHIHIVFEKILQRSGGIQTWIGYLEHDGPLFRTILTLKDDVIFGLIITPSGDLRVDTVDGQTRLIDLRAAGVRRLPLKDDVYRVNQQNRRDLPLPVSRPLNVATPSSPVQIDVMFLYTQSMVDEYGGDLDVRLQLYLDYGNQAFDDSGINVSLNLVHSQLIDYVENTTLDTLLDDIIAGNNNANGDLSGIAALRATHNADLVTVFRRLDLSLHKKCGSSPLPGEGQGMIDPATDKAIGFNTVSDGPDLSGSGSECPLSAYIHETGHSLGSEHDHSDDFGFPGGVFTYSFGHAVHIEFSTVMEVTEEFDVAGTNEVTPEIAMFSNPNVNCVGFNSGSDFPCGVQIGAALEADNATSINTVAESVAAYMEADGDGDGVADSLDNCPLISNTNQLDTDSDGSGDACDTDDDNDSVLDGTDNCPLISNTNQLDTDSDGSGDACDTDDDNDSVVDGADNCPLVANAGQEDNDGDGQGDVCDADDDNDGMSDSFEQTHGFDPLTASDADLDADGDGLTNLREFILGTDPNDANDPAVDSSLILVSAILPSSRSVTVGTTATAFATIINAGSSDATACWISPITSVAADFFFQTTDPATNALTGTRDATVDIAAGAAQTFVFGFTPTAAFGSTDVELQYRCVNTNAAGVFIGLNTLLLSASATPIPDIVALVATVIGDGIVHIPGATGTGFFAVASVNVGKSDTLMVSVDTGGATLPIVTSICETDPATSACINPTNPTTGEVTLTIDANATPTFAVFVEGSEDIAFDPANKRVFVRFKDAGGVTRGSTSVAVQTD